MSQSPPPLCLCFPGGIIMQGHRERFERSHQGPHGQHWQGAQPWALRLRTGETSPSCSGMEPALSPEPTPPPANRGHGVGVGLTAAPGEIPLQGAGVTACWGRRLAVCWEPELFAGRCEAGGCWCDWCVCSPWVWPGWSRVGVLLGSRLSVQ